MSHGQAPFDMRPRYQDVACWQSVFRRYFASVPGSQQFNDMFAGSADKTLRTRMNCKVQLTGMWYAHQSVRQLHAHILGYNTETDRVLFIHQELYRRKLSVTPFLRVPLTEHTVQTPKERILRHHPKHRLGPFVRLPFPFLATQAYPEILQRAEQRENSQTCRCLVLGNCRSGRRGLEECIGHIEVMVMVACLEPPTILVVLIPATDHAEEYLHYAIHVVFLVLILAHDLAEELFTILLLSCE